MSSRFFYSVKYAKDAFMKIKKQRSGFTVMELMVGMIAFSVMVLVVGSMLVFGWLGWRRSAESVAMQRDAVIAMNMIAKEIRMSNLGEISYDSAGIYFGVSNPEVVRSAAVNYPAADIAFSPGVNIKNFGVAIVGNTVDVDFTLYTHDGTDENDYSMSINTRN